MKTPVSAILLFAGSAFAQLGPPSGGSSQSAPATQLPLSGRTGQTGSATATQSSVPGVTGSVNVLNTTIQVQGPYAGSSAGKGAFSGKLTLNDAIARGLEYNLGAVGLNQAVRQARGQSRVARSSLLPNLNGNLSETVQQT